MNFTQKGTLGWRGSSRRYRGAVVGVLAARRTRERLMTPEEIDASAWPLCEKCGVPVHPDAFYQKAHADFFTLNPNIPHARRNPQWIPTISSRH